MNKTALEKKIPAPLREKGQYALAFGVISALLYVTGFPIFLLFFVGVLAFFIWKVFSSDGRHETRRIFEFYLSANEILRDDDRRWYGFEIQETIANGERIVRGMSAAPPLVYFALGLLHQKIDDHSSAVKNLSHVLEETACAESAVVFPTKELREYVQMLRKIERSPSDAPQTSAAIRSLERSRKNRGKEMLEHSRSQSSGENAQLAAAANAPDENTEPAGRPPGLTYDFEGFANAKRSKKGKPVAEQTDRKTISEVLHDIYDRNVQ
ncbi:MAG: hypothetical protein ABIO36_07470 [Pyrinomonadaceae bacterium]